MHRNLSLLASVLLLSALSAPAGAAPSVIPVQGILSDASGQPLTSPRRLTFRLYTSPTAPMGEAVFTEEATVTLSQGFFSTHLGSSGTPPFTLSLFRDHAVLYLGVTVEGDPGELLPRFDIGTAPYAAYAEHAGDAATLEGLSPEDFAMSTHSHSFQSLADVPAGLADGDSDTLASLSCATGETPVKTSVGWGCGSTTSALITDANVSASANISPTKISGTAWTAANDGPGSTLDADKLDGMDAAAFSPTTHSHAFLSLTGVPSGLANGDDDTLATLTCPDGGAPVKSGTGWACWPVIVGTVTNANVAYNAAIEPSKISGTAWTATNDGAGSGLDADTVDGLSTSSLLVTKSRMYSRGVEGAGVAPGASGTSRAECDDTNDVGIFCTCSGDTIQGTGGWGSSPKARIYFQYLSEWPPGKDWCDCGIDNQSAVTLYPYAIIKCLSVI